MIKLVWWLLIGGCRHKWKILKDQPLYEKGATDRPIGTAYTCQCEKCGTPKAFRCVPS